jgi:hypothetical protein
VCLVQYHRLDRLLLDHIPTRIMSKPIFPCDILLNLKYLLPFDYTRKIKT